MADEILISKLVDLVGDITKLGGQRERTTIIPNILVVNANPSDLPTGYIKIRNPRDGTNVPCLTVHGLVVSDNDLVNVLFTEGTEPIALTQGSQSSSSGVKVSELWESDFDAVAWQADVNGHLSATGKNLTTTGDIGGADITASGNTMADAHGFIVKNVSGAIADASDAGYLDENNEYQTTTTTEDERANPVAVLVGGANNADIYVTGGPGRATLNYAGSAPADGDFLTFSTTAGSVQARSTMHYAVLARARAAGGGGTVEVELLLRRKVINIAPSDFMFRVDLASDSDFVALIDSLPGGAVVRYDTPTSGNENVIVPNAATQFAKMILHNTTRGDYALIDTTDTTGGAGYDGEITLTDTVPGTWVAGDTITVRSQTNSDVQGNSYWIDLEFEDTTVVSELATKLFYQATWRDSSGAGESMATHPFKANNVPDQRFTTGSVANILIFQRVTIPLIQRRFQVLWTASGAATARPRMRLTEVEVAI